MEYFRETNESQTSQPLPQKKSIFLRKRFYVVILIIVGIYVGFGNLTKAPSDFPVSGETFTIVPGANVKSLGTELQKLHYIRSQYIFSILITLSGAEHHLSPGDYYFAKPMSVQQIAFQISSGNHNLTPIKVTIPEGVTVSEMSTIVAQKIPAINTATFLKNAAPYEGYLFPETYFMYPKTTADQVIKQMRSMFDQKTSTLFSENNVTEESKPRIVILASLIEREAHGDDDRATIAGILTRRLQLNMPLQVDATVAYANKKAEGSLVKSDFSLDSPYNTYKYKGLPPGPIANPGLEALTAAVNPSPTAYLYYLHDKHGTIHYAKTYAEHLANINRFLR